MMIKDSNMKQYECFLIALRHFIKEEKAKKKGFTQKKMARALKTTPEHLSAILSDNIDRNAGPDLQEDIAKYFDMSLARMQGLGKGFSEGHMPVPADEESATKEVIGGGKGFTERRQMMMVPPRPAPMGLSSESELLASLAQTFANHRQCLSEAEKWRAIIESLGEPVVVINRAMNVEFQNLAHQSLTGGNFLGKNCTTSFEGSGLCSCDDKCPAKKAFDDGFVHRDFMPMGDKTVSVTASPIRDASGIITSVVVIVKDVTERQRIIDEMTELRESHQALFDNLEYPVTVVNKDDLMVYANKMFYTVTGADPTETYNHDTLVILFKKIVKNFDEVYVRVQKVVNKESRREQIPCELLHHDISGVLDIESLFTANGEYIGRISRFRMDM